MVRRRLLWQLRSRGGHGPGHDLIESLGWRQCCVQRAERNSRPSVCHRLEDTALSNSGNNNGIAPYGSPIRERRQCVPRSEAATSRIERSKYSRRFQFIGGATHRPQHGQRAGQPTPAFRYSNSTVNSVHRACTILREVQCAQGWSSIVMIDLPASRTGHEIRFNGGPCRSQDDRAGDWSPATSGRASSTKKAAGLMAKRSACHHEMVSAP